MLLFINTCVRPESRTKILAQKILDSLPSDEVIEIKPDNAPLDYSTLTKRMELSEKGDFNDEIFDDAKLFARADNILIAAPFWDLSFPASLKNFIEAINVVGITFSYTQEGQPYGLCRAKKLIYVTTAGGPLVNNSFGYGYVKELAKNYWGIPDVSCIYVDGLDIVGADVEKILQQEKRLS